LVRISRWVFLTSEPVKEPSSSSPGRRKAAREDTGRVMIQTFYPDHYAVTTARDMITYLLSKEIELREQLGYPPFPYLVCLRLQGTTNRRPKRWPEGWRTDDQVTGVGPKRKDLQVSACGSAGFSKLKGQIRWQIFIRSKGPTCCTCFSKGGRNLKRCSGERRQPHPGIDRIKCLKA